MYLEIITWVANSDGRKHNPRSVVLTFDELLIPASYASGCQYFVMQFRVVQTGSLRDGSDFQFPKAS